MTLKSEVKVGNIGTVLEVTLKEPTDPDTPQGATSPVDLTTSTALLIKLRKPTGGTINATATVKNPPGTDGVMIHTDSTGIFTDKGRWQARGEATFTGGNFFQGSWNGFYVGV